jgi:hypothetical protein
MAFESVVTFQVIEPLSHRARRKVAFELENTASVKNNGGGVSPVGNFLK